MHIDFLVDIFCASAPDPALIWRDRDFRYGWLLDSIWRIQSILDREAVAPGSVCALEADFSPIAVAALLALMERGCIVAPITSVTNTAVDELLAIAQVENRIGIEAGETIAVRRTEASATHDLLRALKDRQRPGLILFSSGSTGKSKAAVHDFVPLLEKYQVRRTAYRALAFLLFDHIGGLNTLLYTLSNAGCLALVDDRSPDAVCATIEKWRIELLPTSPTFLNLILLSGAHQRHDLSSLKIVTYGTEVMPKTTLARFHETFPDVRLQQTYGLSEIGILRSKSESSDSLYVKLGGEGYETRIVNGALEIKAKSAMLGYLNAPSPFTDDGWFRTGDAVEVKGDYVRILGRESDIINVGGEKVYPAEVESVLQMIDGVEEVVVAAEPNVITGQIVTATVRLRNTEAPAEFRKRMRAFCAGRLAPFKVPQKVVLSSMPLHSARFKKMTRVSGQHATDL